MIGSLLLAALSFGSVPMGHGEVVQIAPVAVASERSDLSERFDLSIEIPDTGWYEGSFDRPPVSDWRVRLPGRVSAGTHTERTRPVLHGEHVYVGSAGGDALYVLRRRDGSLARSFPASAPVESEPVVTDERVYFTDTGGSTWAYAHDGELLWQHEGSAPILVKPTVHGDRLYVTNVDDLAYALDLGDGTLQWRYRRPPDLTRATELALYGAPEAVVLGDLVLVGFSDGALVAIEADSGEVAWERRVGEGRYPDLVAAAVAVGSDVIASGYFAPLVAIDQGTQNVRWRLEHGAAHAPAIHGVGERAMLYHPGTDGVLRAVEARTGDVQWSWDSETPGALTTPTMTPAGLLTASSDGQIYLIDMNRGEAVWTYREPVRLVGVTSAPVVDGRQVLFVTNAGWLHSMRVPRQSEPASSPPYPHHRR